MRFCKGHIAEKTKPSKLRHGHGSLQQGSLQRYQQLSGTSTVATRSRHTLYVHLLWKTAFVARFLSLRRFLLQKETETRLGTGHALAAMEAWAKTTSLTTLMAPASGGRKPHLGIHPRKGHAQPAS